MIVADYTILWGGARAFWERWGFEPWRAQGMEGLRRRLVFRKDSLLGEVARYYADDHIVLKHGGARDREAVVRGWPACADVMVQRFVFVDRERPRAVRRSYWLGFRGYLEVYGHTPDEPGDKHARDLTALIDKAWGIVRQADAGHL